MNNLPKKRLLEIRDARISRLEEEQKAIQKRQKEEERKAIKDRILQK